MKIAVIGGGPAGLYFALLAKKSWPANDITVYERNRADATFGFGVVFSDETLDHFLARDPESYAAITGQFAYWDEIDFVLHGETIRSTGHGFCGCGRMELLQILQRRCAEIGVEMKFSHEIKNIEDIDADLVVGADGVNSRAREAFADRFRPRVEWRKNRFAWLGSTRPYEAFTFDFTSFQGEADNWALFFGTDSPHFSLDAATVDIRAVPAPGALALLGLAGVARRRRR